MKIYVATHKETNITLKEPYELILVGANKLEGTSRVNIIKDNLGDNISEKNNSYCELTGLYWIWKNSKEDIIGLCHYRRYFTRNVLSKSSRFFLSKNYIESTMKKYDIILPKKSVATLQNKGVCTVEEAYRKGHVSGDLDVIEKIIKHDYPDYMDAYNKFMKGNKLHSFNMFISKKEIIDNYFEWIFDILKKSEKYIDINDGRDKQQQRVFGYLSERLFNVWIEKNIDKSKIKEEYVIMTANGLFKKIINKIKNEIKFLLYKKNRRL